MTCPMGCEHKCKIMDSITFHEKNHLEEENKKNSSSILLFSKKKHKFTES